MRRSPQRMLRVKRSLRADEVIAGFRRTGGRRAAEFAERIRHGTRLTIHSLVSE